MSLAKQRRNGNSDLVDLLGDVFTDDLFRSFFQSRSIPAVFNPSNTPNLSRPWFNDVGVRTETDEDTNTVTYHFDVPGVSKADINADVNLETRTLKVTAHTEGKASRTFNYKVTVPDDVDLTEDVTDKFQNGVLSLTFKSLSLKDGSPVRTLLTSTKTTE